MTDLEEQKFQCEVCDEEYVVKSDHPLDKVTLDGCRNCNDYSPWALPVGDPE